MAQFGFELEGLSDLLTPSPTPETEGGGGLTGDMTEWIKKLRDKLKTPGFITETARDLARMGAQAPDINQLPEEPLPPAPGTQAPGGVDLSQAVLPPQGVQPLQTPPLQAQGLPPQTAPVPGPGDLLNLGTPGGGQVPVGPPPVPGAGPQDEAGIVQGLKATAETGPEALAERTSGWEIFFSGLEDNPDATLFLLQMAATIGQAPKPGQSGIGQIAQGAVQALSTFRQREASKKRQAVGEERLGIEQERLGLETRRVALSEEEAERKGELAGEQLDLERIRVLAIAKAAEAKEGGKTITPDKAELELINDFAKIALPSQQEPLIARARELAAKIGGTAEVSAADARQATIQKSAEQLPEGDPFAIFQSLLVAQSQKGRDINPGGSTYALLLEVVQTRYPDFQAPQ